MSAAVVTEARSWLGVRWRHQGRSREGVDCIGLVIKVAHGLGLSEFDTADYARQATDETLLAGCRKHLLAVQRSAMAPGHVVVMHFDNQRHIGIVGDYVHGGLSLIHAHALARKVVEHRLDDAWRSRIIAAFAYGGCA